MKNNLVSLFINHTVKKFVLVVFLFLKNTPSVVILLLLVVVVLVSLVVVTVSIEVVLIAVILSFFTKTKPVRRVIVSIMISEMIIKMNILFRLDKHL